MNLNDCIFFALTSSARRAGKYWKQHVAEFGVTGVQALVLNALSEEGESSSVHLGTRVQLDSATMTGVLDRLESAGLIARVPDADDRRAVRLVLTPPGRDITQQLQQRLVEANAGYTHNLNDAEVKTLKRLLSKL